MWVGSCWAGLLIGKKKHQASLSGLSPLKINQASGRSTIPAAGLSKLIAVQPKYSEGNMAAQRTISAFGDDSGLENLTSPSVSQTLGAEDTDSCSSIGEPQVTRKVEIEGKKLIQSAITASWVISLRIIEMLMKGLNYTR